MVRKVIIVIVIFALLVGSLFCLYESYTKNVANSVKLFSFSINDMFIPNRIADRYFYDERGIDSYRLWVYKLKPKETEKVHSDIMNEKYYSSLSFNDFSAECDYFFENNITIDEQHSLYYLNKNSFFVVYDNTTEELIFAVKTI